MLQHFSLVEKWKCRLAYGFRLSFKNKITKTLTCNALFFRFLPTHSLMTWDDDFIFRYILEVEKGHVAKVLGGSACITKLHFYDFPIFGMERDFRKSLSIPKIGNRKSSRFLNRRWNTQCFLTFEKSKKGDFHNGPMDFRLTAKILENWSRFQFDLNLRSKWHGSSQFDHFPSRKGHFDEKFHQFSRRETRRATGVLKIFKNTLTASENAPFNEIKTNLLSIFFFCERSEPNDFLLKGTVK